MLEACRNHCPEAPFIHMSTNKVYGDAPNRIPLIEQERRWDFGDHHKEHGIPETFSMIKACIRCSVLRN
jgi:CDP-paratose 2-epimerase